VALYLCADKPALRCIKSVLLTAYSDAGVSPTSKTGAQADLMLLHGVDWLASALMPTGSSHRALAHSTEVSFEPAIGAGRDYKWIAAGRK